MTRNASLVIAPQWIGDAVMTEPLMRRLAGRGEHLTVAALPWVAPVYRAMPQVAEVIELPFRHGGLQGAARWALGKRLRGQFDRAYVLPNSAKSALIPFFARIPVRVGYRGEWRLGLVNRHLPSPSKKQRPPMVDFYTALADVAPPSSLPSAESGGTFMNPTAAPALTISPVQQQAALGKQAMVAGQYLVFAPGAEFGPAKRWPPAYFAAVAMGRGDPVLLLGSGKELALCEQIREGMPPEAAARTHNLAGKTSLDEALALIAAAKAVVSNDSGLMHVAASLGVPQVAVYGSSSPLHTPPLNTKARVLWLKDDPLYQPALDCAPCFERECPLGHTRCLRDIPPERVLALLPA